MTSRSRLRVLTGAAEVGVDLDADEDNSALGVVAVASAALLPTDVGREEEEVWVL